MAKITIHAVCLVEGDADDVMRYYQDALESMECGGGAYGTVEVRVVAVEGMDFQLDKLDQLFMPSEGN